MLQQALPQPAAAAAAAAAAALAARPLHLSWSLCLIDMCGVGTCVVGWGGGESASCVGLNERVGVVCMVCIAAADRASRSTHMIITMRCDATDRATTTDRFIDQNPSRLYTDRSTFPSDRSLAGPIISGGC